MRRWRAVFGPNTVAVLARGRIIHRTSTAATRYCNRLLGCSVCVAI